MNKKLQYLVVFLVITIASSFLLQKQLSSLPFFNNATVLVEHVDDFSTITNHIDNNTLVLFDLDDTTFTASSFYGSIKYFIHILNERIAKDKISKKEAESAIYPEWIKSQKLAAIKLTDNKIPQQMDTIRKKGVAIYGFTARRPEISEVTLNQLKKLGIKFDFTPEKFNKVYKNQLTNTSFHDSEAIFINGVLFCHEYNEKGKVFKDWYQWLTKQTGKTYTKVLLIDDTTRNIDSMKAATQDLSLDYVGLLYRTKPL